MKLCCLMAVYKKDNEQWLVQAINSVVGQTRIPDEFLIVGDGEITTNQTKIINEYVSEYDFIRFINYKNSRGLWYALKFGIENCNCDLIARMDSDDICDPNRFALEEQEFIKNPNLTIVGSNTIEFIDSIDNIVSKRIMPQHDEEIKKYLKRRNPFIHSSVMFRRDFILKCGNYRNFYLCEDYELWSRVFFNGGNFYNIQKDLVYMRVDENFYKRRGGFKYVKNIVSLKYLLYKEKVSGLNDFIISSISTILVGLSPNFIRSFIYKELLRK